MIHEANPIITELALANAITADQARDNNRNVDRFKDEQKSMAINELTKSLFTTVDSSIKEVSKQGETSVTVCHRYEDPSEIVPSKQAATNVINTLGSLGYLGKVEHNLAIKTITINITW